MSITKLRKIALTLAALAALLLPLTAASQILEPIKWAFSQKAAGKTGTMTFKATIDQGWHLYGLTLPDGGPNPTEFVFDRLDNIELDGTVKPSVAPVEKEDMIFELTLSWWDSDVTFVQKYRVKDPSKPWSVSGYVRFQGCNDSNCIPPTKEEFSFSGAVTASASAQTAAPAETTAAPAVDETAPAADEESAGIAADSAVVAAVAADTPSPSADRSGWWAPVTYPEGAESATESISEASWFYIFAWGFLGGILALLTPCVWPMIPLTVSFFLKKNTSRSRSIRDAMIYGASIIVIYLALGLVITWLFGASKLNELSTNAVFNLLFFLLLVVFAISFFGAFDIRLPSKWSNSMDSRAESTTGLISIFFMAFTLALVSFSCTGPIIGTLLVEAATVGNMAGPAIGMGAFALALAIPFTLFAIFPSMLKEMPRSGGWLNSVKVVLGFLELALSLKFLSVADLAYGWGLLDREWFVALWVVIFVMLGMYLLGKIKFPHDSDIPHVSIPRFFLALASLTFAVYLLPGMWGAPLKGVSAFVPPLYTQDFNLYAGGEFREFDDYDEGMRYAAENGRPVLIDFSGYGCVNCRKMEGAVFDTDVIRSIIEENYVLIRLMVDDKHKLPEPVVIEENGRRRTLQTVGDRWSYLERMKFGANTQPFYILLDNNGQPLAGSYSYDENVEKFGLWLESGIEAYKDR
ncbi:MAG: thioredoxin family protein [Clostridium sp.]|nr:thioredoxin family protein [Clostridium sp.]